MVMSKTYQETEAAAKVEANEKAQQKINDATVVFWSRQERCSLANFREEKRDGHGRIVQPEQSLGFREHILSTNDPVKIAFVKAHNAFATGDVVLCESMEDAHAKTRAQEAIKSGSRDVKVEQVEKTEIQDNPR